MSRGGIIKVITFLSVIVPLELELRCSLLGNIVYYHLIMAQSQQCRWIKKRSSLREEDDWPTFKISDIFTGTRKV